MNEDIINKWNSRIGKNDRVFHCGDFAFHKDPIEITKVVKRLNGMIYLILGNHDYPEIYSKVEGFHWVSAKYQCKMAHIGKQLVFCSHYAHRIWDHAQHGAYHVYGHSHNGLEDDKTLLSCEVGVDAWGCYPVSFEELQAVMTNKEFVPVDHHGKKEENED